jgi:hypothetical protein
MKAKLKKFKTNYDLFVVNEDNQIETFASTDNTFVYKLSKQNCDDIFGVIDVEKLAEDFAKYHSIYPTAQDDTEYGFKNGFNKAMELNKDKVFTESDVRNAIEYGIQSALQTISGVTSTQSILDNFIQQPTEIEVVIEMEDVIQLKKRVGGITNMGKPKLDSEGCLILKRIV